MRFKDNSARLLIDANQRIKEKQYWLDKLSGELVRSAFPCDKQYTDAYKRRLQTVRFQLSGERFEKLMKLSNNSDIRLQIILLAALIGLLNKYTGNRDIIVGTPIKKQQIQGEFINTVLILRNRLPDNSTFKDMLLQLSHTTAEANEHVNYPLETLLNQLNIPYSEEKDFPLFDLALLLTNFQEKEHIQHLNLNMIFSFSRENDCIQGQVEYNTLKYNQPGVERIVAHYQRILGVVLSDINIKFTAIDILGELEKSRLLYDFNNTEASYPKDKTIHQLFAGQVKKTPDNIAVVGPVQVKYRTDMTYMNYITYKELNEKSDQLAYVLKEKGVLPDTIVGIMVERSLEMIIGILGILKAGGAYLPIDAGYPGKRINYMLADSRARVLLTLSKGHQFNCQLSISSARAYLHHSSFIISHSGNLAYIIYTSGSTGKPKGVMIEHHSVINRLNWMQRIYALEEDDVIIQKTPFIFDVSVWELFWWAITGASVFLLQPGAQKEPDKLVEAIEKNKITTMHFVPSMLNAFLEYIEGIDNLKKLASLRQVFSSGEALGIHQVETFNRLLNRGKDNAPQLINLYGPTEATVDVSYFNCSPNRDYNTIPIGKPIDNIHLYVMDKRGGWQPVGIAGELCISGVGLARGYLNNPELTAEKFRSAVICHSPLVISSSEKLSKVTNDQCPTTNDRLYLTGDLARWLPDGNIEFLGRTDYQVKIRGHRIELGEIENQLLKFTPVKETVVVAREDKNKEKQLAAYLVPHPRHCFTIHRLLKLKNQGILRNQRYYLLPNGITVFYLNRAETDFMYKEIFEKRSYTRHGIILEQSACVFDVGANIGIFSLFVNHHCKKAKIFAFEPLPPIFEVLALNTSIYEGDIKIFPCGLSGNEGEMDFTYYPNATVLSGGYADETQEMKNVRAFMRNQPSLESQPGEIGIWEHQLEELLTTRLTTSHFSCQLKTISTIIKENEVDSIDLLKIDVEKSETDVLKGINEEDWSRIRQIVIEVHNVDGRLKMLMEMLKNRGYEVVSEQDSQLHETDLYNIYARQPNPGHEKNPPRQTDLNQCPAQRWTSSEHLIDDIRNFLKEKLPDYMIPTYFMILEQLPLTPNGKIHRNALPELEERVSSQYMAPKSNMEKKVADIWKEILKLERVGLNDSFFDVGGTSINVIQVNTRLRKEFAMNIPVVKMLEYPTVGTFANYLEQQQIKTDESQGKSVNEMEEFDMIHAHSLNALEQTVQLLETEGDGDDV